MTRKKAADLSSSLVAVKGQATAAADATGRQQEPLTEASLTTNATPLNFKVDAAFRRRFRECAARSDLKLNELLRQCLDAWEEKHGVK